MDEIHKHIDILASGIHASLGQRISREHLAFLMELSQAFKQHVSRIALVSFKDEAKESEDLYD